MYMYTHTHTYIHTHIYVYYIYIFIYFLKFIFLMKAWQLGIYEIMELFLIKKILFVNRMKTSNFFKLRFI